MTVALTLFPLGFTSGVNITLPTCWLCGWDEPLKILHNYLQGVLAWFSE